MSLCVNCHERKSHANITSLDESDRIKYLKYIIQEATNALERKL